MKNLTIGAWITYSIIFIIIIFSFLFASCSLNNTCNGREITKLYKIKNYKVYEVGVEIWAISNDGEEKGFFVEHDKVYAYEEDIDEGISRVIILCCSECDSISDGYLYFSREKFKEYIKEKYDIE